VVDLVKEVVAPACAEPTERDGIRVDTVEEIFVNKLTTLVSRVETRDLVDLMALEAEGLAVEDFLGAALLKDGGCTPGQLAWLLDQFPIPDGDLPGSVEREGLIAYRDELVVRMRRAAHP
jgi:hypothetical protein